MASDSSRYEIRPFPKIRRAYVDVLREGHRRHIIHGLVEVDVTDARSALGDQPADGASRLSFTGWIVTCVARAVDENKMMHAHRWGRRRLVLFEDVDVNVQLEQVDTDGNHIVQSRIVRSANHKSVEEVSREIGEARQIGEEDRRRLRGTMLVVTLPGLLRRLLWRGMMARPFWTKRFGGTIAVSSVGMFGAGLGWGIPITPAPLMVTVGGIGVRPALVDGGVESREHLSLTISMDHDIIDGAPAARFVERLRQLVEGAYGLSR